MSTDKPWLDAFKYQLETQFLKQAVCGRDFFLFPSICAWLRETATDDSGQPITQGPRPFTRLELLLLEAHGPEGPTRPRWVDEMMEKFESGHNCHLKVFCILLYLGIGHFFEQLSQYIKDANLPKEPLLDLQSYFELAGEELGVDGETAKSHASRFLEERDRFCAKVIGEPPDHTLSKEIVPICAMQKITDKGAETAEVWRIEIPEDYLTTAIKNVIPAGCLQNGASRTKYPFLGRHALTISLALPACHEVFQREKVLGHGEECLHGADRKRIHSPLSWQLQPGPPSNRRGRGDQDIQPLAGARPVRP